MQLPQLLRLLNSRRHRNRSWHSHCEWLGHVVKKLTEQNQNRLTYKVQGEKR